MKRLIPSYLPLIVSSLNWTNCLGDLCLDAADSHPLNNSK